MKRNGHTPFHLSEETPNNKRHWRLWPSNPPLVVRTLQEGMARSVHVIQGTQDSSKVNKNHELQWKSHDAGSPLWHLICAEQPHFGASPNTL
jgi:hypothetical protein